MVSLKRATGISSLFRHGTECHLPEPIRRSTWRDWLYLIGQFGLVAGVELSDDFIHALHPLGNEPSGLLHAGEVVRFEAAHGFWIEPGIQSFFTHTHTILGEAIGWNQVRPIVDTLYGQGHILFTIVFALWVFFYRRGLFTFVRNVFLITNLLAVALYEAFPLAPPRLYRPDHMLDPIFGPGGVGGSFSFNEYAAMPSVHVAWATIVGVTLFWAARTWIMRVLGLIYPLVMLTTVVVTGNHFLSDALGAEVVVLIALLCAILMAWRASGHHSLRRVLNQLQRLRYGPPVYQGPAPEGQPADAPTVAA
ncbi:MAG TPA: phosphatase PAP2 family protein [Chloroflexota bacterium]|nr:phosphatase PAP2 family protein [Chloroflexota bacterium]